MIRVLFAVFLAVLSLRADAAAPSTPTDAAAVTAGATVALDGSGQYSSLQAAISAAPMKTDPAAPRWVIFVKRGVYHERVYVQRERGWIRIVGEDPEATVLTFDLHAKMEGPDGQPIGTFRTPTLQIDGDGMLWENMTIANSAGPVGQALALRVDGDRVAFRGCRFLGWQDTILVNRGRQYFADCTIEGHVDFIFGGATAYFDRCHIHCVGNGYITAASTPKGEPYGFVFAHSRITGAPDVKTYLGRPWRDFAKTVFLHTEMSDVVRPEGWHNWDKPHAEASTFYAEFGSTGPGANVARRVSWAKPFTEEDAALLTPARVLGGSDGWDPVHDAVSATPDGKPSALAQPTNPSTLPSAPATADRNHRTRVVLVGDSTVTDDAGWGAGFRAWLTSDAECINLARSGRSSKSYRDEGHWETALAAKGAWYLIQFGHNDQPGKGPERETDPATTFPANLARYVAELRAVGARPVLVTSLVRRTFDPARPGKLADTLEPYAEATRRVAREQHVPLADLHARSLALCETLGPAKCDALNYPSKDEKPDRTHLNPEGSAVFAQLVAEELRRAIPELRSLLREAPAPNPAR